MTCAGLALSAVLLWAGSATVWYRGGPDVADALPVELTGAQAAPWLGGTALLALAGVAGVVATSGVLRRLVGVLLGLVGLGVAGFGLRAQFAGPPGELRGPAEVTAAPLLAAAGGLVLLAVGVVVVLRERGLARLGARYAAPGEQRVQRDPDRTAWDELDEGRDPTADPPAAPPGDPGDDPGDGPRSADV